MLVFTAAILAGLVLLIWSADHFVTGAGAIARNLGVPPLLIGLTVVAIGTSAPEILVSAQASLMGNQGLAVGNALGSNIANIALILGATAVLAPIKVKSDVLRKELVMLTLVSLGAMILMMDDELGILDGGLLLIAAVAVTFLLIKIAQQRRKHDVLDQSFSEEIPASLSPLAAYRWTAIGLVLLVLGCKFLVWGAVGVAQALGVSDLVIGLTLVAVGTSLPELATSIAAAFKNQQDLAVGNIIGSNIYNLLLVLPLAGLLAPGELPKEVLERDLPLMFGFTVSLLLMGRGKNGGSGYINRTKGLALLLAFIIYETWLYLHA